MGTYNIIGYVRSTNADGYVKDLSVNLFKPGGSSVLATTQTRAAGFFQFILDDTFFTTNFLSDEDIELKFEVYDAAGYVLLNRADSMSWTQGFDQELVLFIDNNILKPADQYRISGFVKYTNQAPGAGCVVKVYRQLFRENVLIANGAADQAGAYNISYDAAALEGDDLSRVRLLAEVYDPTGVTLITQASVDKVTTDDRVNFDLAVATETTDHFSSISGLLTADLGGASVAGITDEEVQTWAASKGIEPVKAATFVRAHQLSDDIGASSAFERQYMYALLDKHTPDASFISLNATEVTSIVNDAIDAKVISVDAPDVSTFVTKIKAAQVEGLRNIPVRNESYSWDTVLTSALGSSSNVTAFLQEYNDVRHDNEASESFWNTASADIKKGFQLIAVTGAQPQAIELLSAEVASESGIHSLAGQDAAYWTAFVDSASVAAGGLCAPTAIKQLFDESDPEYAAKVKAYYAKILKESVQEAFPLVAVGNYMNGVNGPDLISDTTKRGEVVSFLQNNPDFDLRKTRAADIDDSFDLTGVTNVDALKEELVPFQRLMSVTGGKPDAVIALKSDGLASANEIASMNEEQFVENYGMALGGTENAVQAFRRAENLALITEQVTMGITSWIQDPDTTILPSVNSNNVFSALSMSSPDLVTLFGTMNYCACQSCISLYSPAAYLTDLLNFLRNKAKQSGQEKIYQELLRRRPDIQHIELSCKNTNTQLPYIDLVNEVLESYILELDGETPPPSYQTTGSSDELRAHPEHVYAGVDPISGEKAYQTSTTYEHVYDQVLTGAVYPSSLPFSLALEETRTYLQDLGVSRYELMKVFKSVSGTNDIDDFSLYAEYLGISSNMAKIIAGLTPYNTDIWRFYGFKESTSVALEDGIIDPTNVTGNPITGVWSDILCGRMDVLLQQLRIPYTDLLQLLVTDFLNKDKSVGIVINSDGVAEDAPEDTCNLAYLKLTFADPADQAPFLAKLYRFVRLREATGLPIYELDKLVSRNLGMTDIDQAGFILIGRVLEFAAQLNLTIDELSMFWSDIDSHKYINYQSESLNELPSVYEKIFANKAVINVPIDQFKDPAALTVAYTDQTSLIAAFSRMKETDVVGIMDYLEVEPADTITLPVLSRIYFFGSLSRAIGLSVSQALEVFRIMTSFTGVEIKAFAGLSGGLDELVYLENVISVFVQLRESGYSLEELQYLAQDKGSREQFGIKLKEIQTFYEGLRKELQKFPLEDDGTYTEEVSLLLTASIVQYFEKQFKLSATNIKAILGGFDLLKISSGTINILDALANPGFIAANFSVDDDPYPALSLDNLKFLEQDRVDNGNTTLPHFNLLGIYDCYYLVHKIATIAGKSVIGADLLTYLVSDSTIGLELLSLPVSGETVPMTELLFTGILRLTQWRKAQKQLGLDDDQLADLLRVSVATPDSSITEADLKARWLELVGKNSKVSAVLTDLVGVDNATDPAGLLKMTFNADINPSTPESTRIISNIVTIANWCHYTELSPQRLMNVLVPTLELADAHHVLLAAKSKYNNETWLKVAKPMRDTLRKKQRDALVAYVVANPDPANAGSRKIWRNENEVFAYFLIDVEMDPCMMTSRIRQALNSVQLLVDRVLLGIEYKNYVDIDKLELTGSALRQWEQWRKWYRVWEANRKVFLYPENWIEPDLRTGKSPLFRELESNLKKDDFSNELAEDAYRSYLQGLYEVARLEPMGAFREYLDGDDVSYIGWSGPRPYRLHTIARTYSEPHAYYYRVYSEGEWGAWEKIDIDVQGDHVMPYMYNGRLYLFWLTFQKKVTYYRYVDYPKGYSYWFHNTLHHSEINVPAPPRGRENEYNTQEIMEITLNWSEYKDGRWMKQKAGKDRMQIRLEPDLQSRIEWVMNHQTRERLSRKREQSAYDIVKAQIHMSGSVEKSINGLNVALTFPHYEQGGGADYTAYDKMRYLHCFSFTDGISDPKVMRTRHLRSNFQTPYQTFPENNRFVSYNTKNLSVHETWSIDEQNYLYYLDQKKLQPNRAVHKNSAPIISNSSNLNYRITSISNFINDVYEPDPNNMTARQYYPNYQEFYLNNPLTWDFFYEDENKALFAVNAPKYNPGSGTHMPYYKFTTFFHPYAKELVQKLNSTGISGFLNLSTQFKEVNYFQSTYNPGSWNVHPTHPKHEIDFAYDGPYSCYNWELFFHAPLLIAQRLSDNQKFAEARKWYHYIFDPTSIVDEKGAPTSSKQRFWRFKPFFMAANDVDTLEGLMDQINQGVAEAEAQVSKWENNPFDPHAIARVRTVAYMKNVVMKYLDNLIAWADQLFKQDTVESINEATQLYILAANILGDRPQEIPARVKIASKSYYEIDLETDFDDFSNAKVAIEKYIDPNVPLNSVTSAIPTALYFCRPGNDKLKIYWDTVEDRLYKIRHCMSISGGVRDLSLFGSPIDPGMLVKAAAAGIDTATMLDSLSTAPSNYRFSHVLQKANELCADVKALGGALLSALEKKDAETLALLRSTHEMSVLDKLTQVKELQIQDAEANIVALNKAIDTVTYRKDYYATRLFKNPKEEEALALNRDAMRLQAIAANISAMSSMAASFPTINMQFWAAAGFSFGGQNIASVMQAMSAEIGMVATIANAKAATAATVAGYQRRFEDWQFQAQLAQKEREQMDKQILALQIKKSIAEKELDNHKLQLENTKATDAHMRSKFTNEELYSWMVSQISTTYFQTFQLAYDVAKAAEKCFNYELPFAKKAKAGYIKFGHWDSLKQGLLAGETLQYELRQLENAYMEGNSRDKELTKHVSLLTLNPEALIALKSAGTCSFTVPDWLYDLDYPGHYHRRIKSVSISIPCIAGPYTTVACQLLLNNNHKTFGKDGLKFDVLGAPPVLEIATSSGQNDNGMFEFNFRDERYVPFEGAGAESTWSISLMDDVELRQFDFQTISDVILHVKYTAQGDGFTSEKAGPAKTKLLNLLAGTADANPDMSDVQTLPRYFTLRHEFSQQWYAGFAQQHEVTIDDVPQNIGRLLNLSLRHDQFPYFCKGKEVTIKKLNLFIKAAIVPDTDYVIDIPALGTQAAQVLNAGVVGGYHEVRTTLTDFKIGAGAQATLPIRIYKIEDMVAKLVSESEIEDIFMVVEYAV